MSRRVLVITYYFPPVPGSGSNRWAAMVKYLRRAGHEVTVVTAAPPGHGPSAVDGVVRTANLNSSRVLRRLLLRRDRSAASPSTDAAPMRVMPSILWKGLVPDPWRITWNPYAWRAVQVHLEKGVDCVITSSPADSTHLLGLGLRGTAWIADFRDGWTFEPLRPRFPTQVQRSLDTSMERRIVLGADVVVGATAPIAADFCSRLAVDAIHIPNGFDSESRPGPLPAEYDPDRLLLVHTGALLGPRGRDPRPLLFALRRLVDDDPNLSDRIQLVVAGRSEFDERRLVDEVRLGGVVRQLGHLPREQSLALQRAAHTLILLTSDARSEATGKLYEYLAAKRPIIALADGNEAARIVSSTATGQVVPPNDVAAIADAIRAALAGDLERAYAPHGLEPYTYPAPAEQMAKAVETAIERRCSRMGS